MNQIQKKQGEWRYQWENLKDDSLWLFKDWIYPTELEDFKDKLVLDAGCGGGQHTGFVASYAKKVVAVDLNAIDAAKIHNANHSNIEFKEADIALFSYEEPFDIVYSMGVIHHTDDPEKTFDNLYRLLKNNGKLILFAYSYEGNFLNRAILEPLKRFIFLRLPKKVLMFLSYCITILLYIPIYTLYFLPLYFLPYYKYFQNFRRLSFYRNNLNVFDKLNAPQTHFITKERVEKWFTDDKFREVYIDHYNGVVWRASGVKI